MKSLFENTQVADYQNKTNIFSLYVLIEGLYGVN